MALEDWLMALLAALDPDALEAAAAPEDRRRAAAAAAGRNKMSDDCLPIGLDRCGTALHGRAG